MKSYMDFTQMFRLKISKFTQGGGNNSFIQAGYHYQFFKIVLIQIHDVMFSLTCSSNLKQFRFV